MSIDNFSDVLSTVVKDANIVFHQFKFRLSIGEDKTLRANSIRWSALICLWAWQGCTLNENSQCLNQVVCSVCRPWKKAKMDRLFDCHGQTSWFIWLKSRRSTENEKWCTSMYIEIAGSAVLEKVSNETPLSWAVGKRAKMFFYKMDMKLEEIVQ